MGTIGDAKDVARLLPLTIAIPSKQGVVLMSHDSSPGTKRPEMPLCPAYRFCIESKGLHRSPMLDSDHDQQITTPHDLLQAIKEAAIRLIPLIASDIEERRRRDADPRMRYSDSRQYERNNQSRSPGSGLIPVSSSSVCALCGVALHLKDSSKESRKFVIDREKSDYGHGVSSKQPDNTILKMAYKISLPAKKDETTDNVSITGSIYDYILSKENDSIDMSAKGQETISSKTQSTDTSESGLKSKLLFIRRVPSDRITHQNKSQRKYASQVLRSVTSKREYETNELSNQCIVNVSSTISSTRDASTLTQEMLCPCACGLLVKDDTESEISINPMPIFKDKFIKITLEELGLRLDSKEMTQTKVHDDIVKVKRTKTQKLPKDINVKRWTKEVAQLRLQVQIEELHKNIQFFKQENEYIRRLAEKCRCLAEDINSLQQSLSIRDTHSELTTTIKHLQAKYHNKHGIIATLTEIFRGSISIQQIGVKLLAPLIKHWNPRYNTLTTNVSSGPTARVPLKPPSSIVL